MAARGILRAPSRFRSRDDAGDNPGTGTRAVRADASFSRRDASFSFAAVGATASGGLWRSAGDRTSDSFSGRGGFGSRPRLNTARTSSTTARVIGETRHSDFSVCFSGAAAPFRAALSFSRFSLRLYASTVASALSSLLVSKRSSAFLVSSAFIASSRERSHASSRTCVSSSSASRRFLLSAYSTTCLMSFATLRLSSGARSCSVHPATSAVAVSEVTGAVVEANDQSCARKGASAGGRWSIPEAAAPSPPSISREGTGGTAASAGAGTGAGAGGRERVFLGFCATAAAAGGRIEAAGFALAVAATRERTCAYGSFSLARAVAAPRVPCAGGFTAPLPNEAEAPHGFCAGATDARASASDRRAIATVDVPPSADARASSRAPPVISSFPPQPSRKPRNARPFARKRSESRGVFRVEHSRRRTFSTTLIKRVVLVCSAKNVCPIAVVSTLSSTLVT